MIPHRRSLLLSLEDREHASAVPDRLLLNDGQLVFQANQVAQPLHGQRRKEKIPELSGAIQCRGVKDHMVVDVLPVRMGGNNKRILALGKTHGKFVAHLVSFLCSDFPRTKGLPYLISDHIAFLSASVYEIILPLGKHKFFICCQGATA